jgi:hypothetical protein
MLRSFSKLMELFRAFLVDTSNVPAMRR